MSKVWKTFLNLLKIVCHTVFRIPILLKDLTLITMTRTHYYRRKGNLTLLKKKIGLIEKLKKIRHSYG